VEFETMAHKLWFHFVATLMFTMCQGERVYIGNYE